MCNYHTLGNDFLQYKRFLGYKYKTDEIVIKEIIKYLENNNINIITKEIVEDYARINSNLSPNFREEYDDGEVVKPASEKDTFDTDDLTDKDLYDPEEVPKIPDDFYREAEEKVKENMTAGWKNVLKSIRGKKFINKNMHDMLNWIKEQSGLDIKHAAMLTRKDDGSYSINESQNISDATKDKLNITENEALFKKILSHKKTLYVSDPFSSDSLKNKFDAYKLLSKINGLDAESIINASKLVGYDVCYRAGMAHFKPVSEIAPDTDTIANIITMIKRTLSFWEQYGPIIKDGFTFKGGYTSIMMDIKNGRKTEVDTISGAVVAKAHELGIPVPHHEMAVSLIHALEGVKRG